MNDTLRYTGIFFLLALLCLKLYKIFVHYFKKERVSGEIEGPAQAAAAGPETAGVPARLLPPRPALSAGAARKLGE